MTDKVAGPDGSALSEGLGAGAEAHKCPECHGKGWNDAWKKVAGHCMGGEVFREDCDHCDGMGTV